MKTLALSGGDLMVGSSGFATLTGTAKIRQDLANALGEFWDTDRFHRERWGSTVTAYIGLPLTEDVQFEVRSEVTRVIQQYINIQQAEILADVRRGKRSRYQTADVIRSINSVQVRADFDAVRVRVSLSTAAGSEVEINRTLVR